MDIDSAIKECKKYCGDQQRAAHQILRLLLMVGMSVFMLIFMIFMLTTMSSFLGSEVKFLGGIADSPVTNILIFGFLTIFSVILGVLVSLYRFHLNEIARTEHYIIGFMRVRAAATCDHSTPKEVINSLTDSAFRFISAHKPNKDKGVENPVPGHPTLELSTILINKLIDSVEITPKKDLNVTARGSTPES